MTGYVLFIKGLMIGAAQDGRTVSSGGGFGVVVSDDRVKEGDDVVVQELRAGRVVRHYHGKAQEAGNVKCSV